MSLMRRSVRCSTSPSAATGNGNLVGVTDNAASGRAAVFTYTDNDRLVSANCI